MWDVGGGCMFRQLFKQYFDEVVGIIYIIRFDED
jgi:hypothetical protein